MLSEKIIFQDSLGTNLVGILSRPSDRYDMPIVIACHGFTSSKDRTTYTSLEKLLIEKGIALFRFDFYAHGESGGDFADISLSKGVDGALQAYNLIRDKGFTHIGLFGSSFGGCIALNTASILNEKLLCLVCKAPVSDYAKQREERLGEVGMRERKKSGWSTYTTSKGEELKIKYDFYEDMAKNNVHTIAENITIPTLIVHGTADTTVLPSQSKKTAELLPNCTLTLIPGASHRFDNPGERDSTNTSFVDFFMSYLGNQ